MNKVRNKILIIGPGAMGYEYFRCLDAQNCEVHVIGRSKSSFDRFKTNNASFYIGIDDFKKKNNVKDFSLVIISVAVEALVDSAKTAISLGFNRILIEKPAALHKKEIVNLNETAIKNNTQIYIAYNRRYYGSIQKALKIIEEDGGALSCHFDFTEWESSVMSSGFDSKVLNRWFFANSTHILDTIFFLIGVPKQLNFHGRKLLKWHDGNSIFAGSGISSENVLFSFHSNWNSAGRWSIEISTNAHKIIFCPIEDIKLMKKNSVEIYQEDRDKYDIDFKPGLFRQIEDLLNKNPKYACSMDEHIKNWDFYEDIFKRSK